MTNEYLKNKIKTKQYAVIVINRYTLNTGSEAHTCGTFSYITGMTDEELEGFVL